MRKLFPDSDSSSSVKRFQKVSQFDAIWPLLAKLEEKKDKLFWAAKKSKRSDSLAFLKYRDLKEALENAYYLIRDYDKQEERSDLDDNLLEEMTLLTNLLGVFGRLDKLSLPRSSSQQVINSAAPVVGSVVGALTGAAVSGPVGGASGFFAGATAGKLLSPGSTPESYKLCGKLVDIIIEDLKTKIFELGFEKPIGYRILNSEPSDSSLSLGYIYLWRDEKTFDTVACCLDGQNNKVTYRLPNTRHLSWWPRLSDDKSAKYYMYPYAPISLRAIDVIGRKSHLKRLETSPPSQSIQNSVGYH